MGYESDLQDALQTLIQDNCPSFDDDSVIINDWKFRDWSFERSPYAAIINAVDFEIAEYQKIWVARVSVIVSWSDWEASYNLFRDSRDELIAGLYDRTVTIDGNQSTITRVYNGGVITEFYDPLQDERYIHESMPLFIAQQVNIEVISGTC